MASLTRWVLAHRKLVVAFWVVLTIAGIVAAPAATKAMNQRFTVPGQKAWEANQKIQRLYHTTGGGDTVPLVPVVALPKGTSVTSPSVRADLRRIDATLARAVPGVRIASFASTGDRTFVSRDGRTTFALAYPPRSKNAFGDNADAEKAARRALRGATVGGAPVHLTGYDALVATSSSGNGPGVFLEALVGGVGALCVLGFVFASLLAFVPILMAIVSIMTTFLVLYGVTRVTGVSPIVQFLVALIGLGVAIDYSLLIVVRWREESAHGAAGDEAIVQAMGTAGRAVVFSGTTVAIGLIALIALPLPFLRSVGYGGMLIPLISTLVAITLLPIVLHNWGHRLSWPRLRSDDQASRSWTRWAGLVVRRRWPAVLAAAAVLAALVIAATGLHFGQSDPNTLAKQGDAKAGLAVLQRSGIGGGVISPVEILTGPGDGPAVAKATAAVPGVHGAIAPADAQWRSDGTALVDVFPVADGSSGKGRDTAKAVRDAAQAAAPVQAGGAVLQNLAFVDSVYGNFPLMIALIGIVTFLLLARAFRSLLLPLKAVLLNIISVTAAWGVLVIVWQQGHGSDTIWGIAATGSIESWIPLMLFAFLFGLSMDYEVFILARMREEYDKTGDTREAVVRGIGRTGRLVTSAALILFLAFAALASGPETDIKVMATGLAAGILLDATVIRALLVPAVVSLFGRWNWWLPPGPARLLRVEPSLPPGTAASEASGD